MEQTQLARIILLRQSAGYTSCPTESERGEKVFQSYPGSDLAYGTFSISMYRIAIMLSCRRAIILVKFNPSHSGPWGHPKLKQICAHKSSGILVILHVISIHIAAGFKRQGSLQRPHPVAIRLHVMSSCMLHSLLAHLGWK